MPELLLPRLKREIEDRLAELRPLVAEAAHLEAAKRALLDDAEVSSRRRNPGTAGDPGRHEPAPAPRMRLPAPSARAAMPSAGALGTAPRSAGAPRAAASNGGEANGTAAPATSRDVIVALVEERPGVSVAEIAAVTKIAKPTVATTVSKLKRDGVLADEAGGVKLASRQPVTLERVAKALSRDDGVDDAEWDAAGPSGKEAA